MASLPRARATPEQYLAQERNAEHKSEYWSGEIVAMAGSSLSHNRITLNIGRRLSDQLDASPCEPFVNDLRVRVNSTKYFYPDVAVTCGSPVFEDAELDTLLTPQVIMEVLSSSTANDDHGIKFAYYRQIPTLTDYVLVSQNEPLVEHYARQDDDHWLLTILSGFGAVLSLPILGCELPLSEVYARVTFPPAAESERD